MNYKIRKLLIKDISSEYINTINHKNTKKFILFAKEGKYKKKRSDLENYIKYLPKGDYLYGVFKNKTHVANFKFQKNKKKIYIGFLTLNKYQGKGIFQKIFPKIIDKFKLNFKNKNRLYLGVDQNNSRAISLYKKIGFIRLRDSKRDMFLNLMKFKKKNNLFL